jgi:hypothetical protein
MAQTIDTYAFSNNSLEIGISGANVAQTGFSFKNTLAYPVRITNIQLTLRRQGTISGTYALELYNHTGTYGSGGLPTGSPIASQSYIVSSLPTTAAVRNHAVTNSPVILQPNTPYFLIINYPGGDSTNLLGVQVDASNPISHPGNSAFFFGTWQDDPSYDYTFIIEGDYIMDKDQVGIMKIVPTGSIAIVPPNPGVEGYSGGFGSILSWGAQGVGEVFLPTTTGVDRDQTGIIRVQQTYDKDQTGQIRVQQTYDKDQNGVIRVQQTYDKDQPGKLRIQATLDRDQTGVIRVQRTYDKDQTGVLKIVELTTRDQIGRISIAGLVDKDQQGIIRVWKNIEKDQTGVISIDNPLVFAGIYRPALKSDGEIQPVEAKDPGVIVPAMITKGSFEADDSTETGIYIPKTN